MSQITTYTGKRFNPLLPQKEDIDIRDIAHALSLTCRGNGHVTHFYSVAQHSIACCKEAISRNYSERVQLACLLHDASEAYLSDVTRPVKRKMEKYMEVESVLQGTIWETYFEEPLTEEELQLVKKVDDDMMVLELEKLLCMKTEMRGEPIISAPSLKFCDMQEVENEFLKTAKSLNVKITPLFRKATMEDLDQIGAIYDKIHTMEEEGNTTIGWVRMIYPTRETARKSIEIGDMFVEEVDQKIVAAAKINQEQVDVYAKVSWKYEAQDEQVMVLHTLVVDPEEKGKGYGKAFVNYYEHYACRWRCHCLRIDTNQKNSVARNLYKKLGYLEAGIVPCVFNGIEGVGLVCLEKRV